MCLTPLDVNVLLLTEKLNSAKIKLWLKKKIGFFFLLSHKNKVLELSLKQQMTITSNTGSKNLKYR